MPTIAFIQGKGGTSKTTNAVMIAHALARKGAGITIGYCDLDHNADATTRLTEHPHELISLLPTAGETEESVDLRIIDTEGRSRVDQTLMYLPKAIDLYVIPCGASVTEVRGAKKTIEMINQKRPGAAMRLLWSRVTTSANNGKPAVLAAHAKALGIPAFRGVIARSTDYENTQTEGWQALSTRHRAEVEGVAIEMLAVLMKR